MIEQIFILEKILFLKFLFVLGFLKDGTGCTAQYFEICLNTYLKTYWKNVHVCENKIVIQLAF